MGLNQRAITLSGFLFFALGATLSASPRLSLTQTALAVSVQAGFNGPAQSIDTVNLGDGFLNLSTSSSVSWLVPSIGASHSCSLRGNCVPVLIALQTSALTKGIYTGVVTVSDPNAIDAPQSITVTVSVGGNVPDNLAFYLQPGGSATSNFITGGPVAANVSNNTPWLSIAVNGSGSFTFNVPYQVKATAQNGMATGDYNGSIALSGSTFGPDNKTVGVVLHVTTQPILQPSSSSLQFQIAQGGNKQTIPVALSNSGQGTLSVTSVTAAAASGTWLSAQTISGGMNVTADPTGLAPNVYQGTVTVASNAANSSIVIPVQLTVEAAGSPVTFAGGVLNNGTFASGESLAQGDIVALFGDQFTYGDPQAAPNFPLQTTLAGTQVLVNNVAVPLFYVSPGQINFEVPIDAATGDGTVRVVRNNQQSNAAYINIAPRVPRFLLLGGGPYAIMTTPAGALTGIPGAPVKVGDTIVIYVIGLGPTVPVVPSGQASPGLTPGSTPARVQNVPSVCFGNQSPFSQPVCATPFFAGLTAGFVGLYQINVNIPQGVPSGTIPFNFNTSDSQSNVVSLVVQ